MTDSQVSHDLLVIGGGVNGAGIAADVPPVALLLKQVRMQACVFVHLERKVVTDRQGKVDLPHGVGGEMQRVHQPAGDE